MSVEVLQYRCGNPPRRVGRTHVVEVVPLAHELDAHLSPGVTTVGHDDLQLGKEVADLVEHDRVLATSRYAWTGYPHVHADGDPQLHALGVDRVVRRVVIGELGLQGHDPRHDVAAVSHSMFE